MPGGHFKNLHYTFYFSFRHEKKQYNPLFRVPTGHSGGIHSIHCFRVPTGLSGYTGLECHEKQVQSIVLECLPNAHEKSWFSAFTRAKPDFAHRKPKTETSGHWLSERFEESEKQSRTAFCRRFKGFERFKKFKRYR